MKFFSWFPTVGKLGGFLKDNVTRPGRAFLFLMFFCSLGLVYLDSPLLYLFCAIFSILVLAGVVSFAFRPDIGFRIFVPELASAGEPIQADIFLTNQRQRSCFEVFIESHEGDESPVRIATPESQVRNILRPGKTIRQKSTFSFSKRGVYPAPSVSAGSTFPFNLFRFRQHHRPSEKIIVTPAFRPIQGFELPTSHFSADFENEKNIQMAHAAGASEYIGNREYQEGLPVRRWDYPSWARTGKPTVREYRENQRGTATIFVDNFFQQPESGPPPEFEALLSLATAIADALRHHQLDIGKLILGNRIYTVFDSAREEQIRSIGRRLALAEIQPESDAASLLEADFLDRATSEREFSFLLLSKLDPVRKKLQRHSQLSSHSCRSLVLGQAPADTQVIAVSLQQVEKGGIVLK
mgnify:CR=1 FL=1